MDGDSTLNTDDYAFTLTGLIHSMVLILCNGFRYDDTATTITTLDGNDITTGSAADIINQVQVQI